MPSLLRFLTLIGVLGGVTYGAMFMLATWFDPKPREITVSIPPDQLRQATLDRDISAVAAKAKHSDPALIELFLDMVAAERGAAHEHARGVCARSRPISAPRWRRADAASPMPPPRICAPIWQRSRRRGFAAASVARRLSAIRQLYRFLYAEGRRADDPSAVIDGPKRGRALPKVLGIAEVDRLLAAGAVRDEPSRISRCGSGCAPPGSPA